jgi:hypothetical protein
VVVVVVVEERGERREGGSGWRNRVLTEAGWLWPRSDSGSGSGLGLGLVLVLVLAVIDVLTGQFGLVIHSGRQAFCGRGSQCHSRLRWVYS